MFLTMFGDGFFLNDYMVVPVTKIERYAKVADNNNNNSSNNKSMDDNGGSNHNESVILPSLTEQNTNNESEKGMPQNLTTSENPRLLRR